MPSRYNFVPCPPGYTRGSRTNRCGKLPEAQRTTHHPLKPCRGPAWQRGGRTNRCGKLPQVLRRVRHGLVPCVPPRERNPGTRRCWSLVPRPASHHALVPCAPPKIYRSERTNRCGAKPDAERRRRKR